MAKLKSTRGAVTGGSKNVPLTDELYAVLNAGNQFIAKLAEAMNVEVMIGEFNGHNYVARETIVALDETMF